MKHFYCSALSGEYCYQGLVLYNSLQKYDKSYTMFCVCLDYSAYEILSGLKLQNLILITIEQLENYYPELKHAKQDRAMNEYAWTIKASEILYIFKKYQEIDKIIWLDSDMQMLSNPEEIFLEWGSHSIILTEQYYTDCHEPLVKTYGRFQAGFVGFRNDHAGISALKWWQKRCNEWCYITFEEGRWADQKYLDMMPRLCKKTCIIKSLGINMTPFILYRLNFEQQKYIDSNHNELSINGTKLVLVHYYGFKFSHDKAIDLCRYWMKFTGNTIEYLYAPYIEACKAAINEIGKIKADYKQMYEPESKRILNYFDLSRSKSDVPYDIATIVRQESLQEALALYNSVLQNDSCFYWWVCCTDIESYKTLQGLGLPNTTAVFIDNLLDSTLCTEIKSKPDINNTEILKTYFLFYLLKNNYSINKLFYINSDFYLFGSLGDTLEQFTGHNALLFKDFKKGSNKQTAECDRDLFGLVNCKEIVDFLQYCIEKPKGVSRLIEMISKFLNPKILNRLEYCSTFQDLKYNKIILENGSLYINQNLIRGFHFIDNDKLQNGSTKTNMKAKKYLKDELYSYIYDEYNKTLSKANVMISNNS